MPPPLFNYHNLYDVIKPRRSARGRALLIHAMIEGNWELGIGNWSLTRLHLTEFLSSVTLEGE
ncbi:MAG: hypothetical protein F6K38_12090 [Moorea sp. SIO3B2]|uniref:hypothetical protein n=1 Tax=Moorena sp. SIO4E2 TaxID=2607826 RepID=UPI0013C5810D|nr:hypothetical protein [Moorena sp. SIO4E2]NEP32178.1 hypothetical protein [Moorena sp. SIO3B2]